MIRTRGGQRSFSDPILFGAHIPIPRRCWIRFFASCQLDEVLGRDELVDEVLEALRKRNRTDRVRARERTRTFCRARGHAGTQEEKHGSRGSKAPSGWRASPCGPDCRLVRVHREHCRESSDGVTRPEMGALLRDDWQWTRSIRGGRSAPSSCATRFVGRSEPPRSPVSACCSCMQPTSTHAASTNAYRCAAAHARLEGRAPRRILSRLL